jgi:hypothetical protein
MMGRRSGIVLILWAAFVAMPALAAETAPATARARVDHHLREIERLTGHFETLLAATCPRFASRAEWDAYAEAEADRLVLLVAHLEEAWVEAKRTGDDDIRRAAKAPKRQGDQGRALVDKLSACAEMNGASLSPLGVWRRVERDLPRRQAEIALPR